MNFLKENFERLKQQGLKETFDALESAFKKFDIDYYLIGARARDLWINHLNLPDKRTTVDVDFTIYINKHSQYNNLVAELVSKGFEQNRQMPYRFFFNGTIDIIPFGGIENHRGVSLDNPPTELSVYGTKEVVAHSKIVKGNFKVITLPGLCVMKLISFSNKPDMRGKDVEDFYFLLENYGEISGNLLFENVEYEDLIRGEVELPIASARLLGRQINRIIVSEKDIRSIILDALNNRIKNFSFEDIESMYQGRDAGDQKIERMRLIVEVIRGIND